MVAYEGALYIFGGLRALSFAVDPDAGGAYPLLGDMLMYDLSDDARKWIDLSPRFVGPSPEPRALMGFEVCAGTFYVHGGSRGLAGMRKQR